MLGILSELNNIKLAVVGSNQVGLRTAAHFSNEGFGPYNFIHIYPEVRR